MHDPDPTVSVVIPTFNRSSTLKRAVASAFAQAGIQVEVIVVDDGSTDDTGVVLQDLQSHHGRHLRIIRQANAGASAARNTGLDAAKGAYVQFLDSDDTLHPEKLQRQIQAYNDAPDTSIVLCHGWLETAGDDERIGQDLGPDPTSYLEALCGRTVHLVPTLAPLWRRSYLLQDRRWSTDISLGDDLEFHIRCIADASCIAFVSQDLFTVHHHVGDRLSDFSHDNERLGSLLTTRERIHAALVARGRWTEGCAQATAATLRSIFTVYLTRMSGADIRHFEQVASRICGPDWQSPALRSFHMIRRTFGAGAARSCLTAANRARAMRPRLTKAAWGVRCRKLVKALTPDPRYHVAAARSAARHLSQVHPRTPSALYFEFNEFHAEIIPGYAALLSHAGYQVTVLHRIGSDVQGAVSRLPDTLRPRLVGLTLKEMRAIARSDIPGRYDLVMLGSGLLAERDGYYGGTLDYIGRIPNGRHGHLVVEHEISRLDHRDDHLRSAQMFALRDVKTARTFIPMLAPVEFGKVISGGASKPVQMLVIGRLNEDMRDINGLFHAVRNILKIPGPEFEIHVIGGAKLESVPNDLHDVFRTLGRLDFKDMYEAIEQADFLMPLLNSSIPKHRKYLNHDTTGTHQLSLGFQKPMIIDEVFSQAYVLDQKTAVIHGADGLLDGMNRARNLSRSELSVMHDALAKKKRRNMNLSLENFHQAFPCRKSQCVCDIGQTNQ